METPEEPRDPCQHRRGSLRFLPQLQMRTGALGVTGDESRQASRKLHGDWIFLRKHEWVSGPHCNSRGTPNFLPQLRKNQEILPSTRDEALSHYGISRENPPSVLCLQRVIDTLEATQEVPRHTRLHSSGTPSVPPQLKKKPGFPSSF